MESKEASSQENIAEHIELYQQAKFREAETGFIADVETARRSPAPPLELARALNNLSIGYFALSKYKQAIESLDEALLLLQSCSESDETTILRACCLNNRARICLEFDEFPETETLLLEAIDLSKPIRSGYAAEFAGNLAAFYCNMPQFRTKVKAIADEFQRLHALNEPIEIYLDDIAGWRRPGKGWDQPGAASPESIEVRNIFNRIAYKYESMIESKVDYQKILQIDEESKQVPPHLVVHAYIGLVDISFMETDFDAAAEYGDKILQVIASSYLRTHPASYRALLKAATASLNSPEKCKTLFNQALELASKDLGELTRHYAHCLSTKIFMQQFLQPVGDEESKENLLSLRKCLGIAQNLFPDSFSYVIELQLLVADACISLNQLEEAEELIKLGLSNLPKNFFANELECKCCTSYVALCTKQGKMEAVKELLRRNEELLSQQFSNSIADKMQRLFLLANQFMEAKFPADAERVYRNAVELSSPLGGQTAQMALRQLAFFLMQIGKSQEGSAILKNSLNGPGQKSRRDELIQQSQLALSLSAQHQAEEAKTLATSVMNEAHQHMPECEEAFMTAVLVLIEQAKKANQADEMLRLIGMLDEFKELFRIRSIMPNLYLETAQLFAAQNSIKANALFEKALQVAENTKALNPNMLDKCCFAYMNYVMAQDNKKALRLCELLIEIRASASSKSSKPYAEALTSKAFILAENDPHGAELCCRESLAILGNHEGSDSLDMFMPLTVLLRVLKKLLRFEECKEIENQLTAINEEIKKRVSAVEAQFKTLNGSQPDTN